jgi:DNA end-binding protein Ku
MPRAVWSGTIGFGLVTVPVRLYAAVQEHALRFRLVHVPDSSPIGYEKVCKAEGVSVPDKEIAKAYEYRRGEFVLLDDEDFEAARAEGGHSIDIVDFVPIDEIDPLYFAHSYYVGPGEGAERAYSLLVRAMDEAGLAAVATFVMREREYLAALRTRDGVLVLEQLHFADEIRSPDDVRPARKGRVDKRELKMAAEMIDSLRRSFDPERYEDTYRNALKRVIDAKRKGKEVRRAPNEEPPEEAPDLLEALRASVEQAKKRPARRRSTGKRSTGSRRGRRTQGRRTSA